MENLVHVVPLGWEFDRVVLPIERMRAHRVHLLCNPASHPNQRHFFDKVKRSLEKKGVEVRQVIVNANADLGGVMKAVTMVIRSELNAGNRVYVNISGAGKIASSAATIAAMAHLPAARGMVYYVVPDRYTASAKERLKHGLAAGMKGDPVPIPLFELRLPTPERQLVLEGLLARPDRRLSYAEIIDLLRVGRTPGFEEAHYARASRAEKNKLNVRLNKRVIERLRNESLIRVLPAGQRRVAELTREGEYLAILCSQPR